MSANTELVLIMGDSTAGKSYSLRTIPKDMHKGVWYLNCEAGKKIPFKNKFKEFVITDPYDVCDAFEDAEEDDNCHTIVIDTFTYLMTQLESQYVLTSKNTQKAWGEYAEYFNDLMLNYVANSTKNVVILAHGANLDNEDDEIRGKYGVKVKGSIMAKGVESLFNTVIFATTVDIKELKNYKNDMLNITEEEEILGFKHVFQTRVTKQTKRHRIRQPDGMWDITETYIDNDICHVLDRLAEYYDDED